MTCISAPLCAASLVALAAGSADCPRRCCLFIYLALPCLALQEELSTWTAAFREMHNRKPNLVDVQRTGGWASAVAAATLALLQGMRACNPM